MAPSTPSRTGTFSSFISALCHDHTRKRNEVVHDGSDVQVSTSAARRLPPQTVCGILRALLDMPLDVLEEIFLMCDPATLVNVSRTNKAFCRLLQSSAYSHVWREVFARQRIPEAPEGWSLVKWAGLLFGERCCQVCLNTEVDDVSFGILKRICEQCIRATMIACDGYMYGVKPGYDSGSQIPASIFQSIMPTAEIYHTDSGKTVHHYTFAYESDVNAYVADLDTLPLSIGGRSYTDYMNDRLKAFSSRLAHIKRLEKWQNILTLRLWILRGLPRDLQDQLVRV